MKTSKHGKAMQFAIVSILALASLCLASCQKKTQATTPSSVATSAASANSPTCGIPANETWLPAVGEPTDGDPGQHAAECVFYQAAWKHFLFSTQLDSNKAPAFLGYDSVESLFGPSASPLFAAHRAGEMSAALRVAKLPNSAPGGLPLDGSGIRQAGAPQGILLDQSGSPIYYAIHLNNHFAEFIRGRQLTTPGALQGADPALAFPAQVVELKSAWRVVDPAHPPADYITVKASVPSLHIVGGKLTEDPAHPRNVMLALVGLHVVFAMQNHPEFVWSTFEHVDSHGNPDSAPLGSGGANPAAVPIQGVAYAFYPGSASAKPNRALHPATFDDATQTFKDGAGPAANTLFRVFSNSKSKDNGPDDDVTNLNAAVASAFSKSAATDARSHYRLVGAVWLENGAADFKLKTDPAHDQPFDNSPTQDVETPTNRTLAGEDRLSSLAMESFTQTSEHNCFSCHDTQRVLSDVDGHQIVGPKLLNISHVISRFLSEKPQ